MMDQGIEIGFGVKLTEHFQHFLSAAHAGEPVVDERYLHRFSSARS